MSPNNRILNRMVLLLIGVVLLAGGAAASVWVWKPTVLEQAIAQIQAWFPQLFSQTVQFGDMSASLFGIILAAAALLIVVLGLIFMLTRRTNSTDVLWKVEGKTGTSRASTQVLEDFLKLQLGSMPELLEVRSRAYRHRNSRVTLVELYVREGASLARLLREANSGLSVWDELTGSEQAIVLRVGGRRFRDRFRASSRVR